MHKDNQKVKNLTKNEVNYKKFTNDAYYVWLLIFYRNMCNIKRVALKVLR